MGVVAHLQVGTRKTTVYVPDTLVVVHEENKVARVAKAVHFERVPHEGSRKATRFGEIELPYGAFLYHSAGHRPLFPASSDNEVVTASHDRNPQN